jgi:hypothetical protein
VFAQTTAMKLAKTNEPKGHRYRVEVGTILQEYGLDEIDKGARCRLVEVIKNLAAIRKWRAPLDVSQKARLNHPRPVLSAWKCSLKDPNEKSGSKPNPELVNIWESATTEDRRAALDAGGGDQLLKDLSPALLKFLEQRLSNPHTVNRLADKTAKEKAAVEEEKKAIAKRAQEKGRFDGSYDGSTSVTKTKKETVKMVVPNKFKKWKKVPDDKLDDFILTLERRIEHEHLPAGVMKFLDAMRALRDTRKKTNTAIARQGNQGDPTEEARQRSADNAKRFAEEPQAVAA